MIREDGTSTISVRTEENGLIVGTDENSSVQVLTSNHRLTIRSGDVDFSISASEAWSLRDLLTRVLDETVAPA